jgi:hypothetical protein
MAQMDDNVVQSVLMPLLQKKGVDMVGISTTDYGMGTWGRWLTAQNRDGSMIFEVIRIKNACSVCIEAEREADCTHTAGETPAWLTRDQDAALRALAGDIIMAREVLNVDNSRSVQPFYPQRLLDRIQNFATSAVSVTESVKAVFIGVDPAGGGKSDYALVSMCQLRNSEDFVVCTHPQPLERGHGLARVRRAHWHAVPPHGHRRVEHRHGVHAHVRVQLGRGDGRPERHRRCAGRRREAGHQPRAGAAEGGVEGDVGPEQHGQQQTQRVLGGQRGVRARRGGEHAVQRRDVAALVGVGGQHGVERADRQRGQLVAAEGVQPRHPVRLRRRRQPVRRHDGGVRVQTRQHEHVRLVTRHQKLTPRV